MSRISVIVPTVGRGTLQRAVDSAMDADEIIIVGDGCEPSFKGTEKTKVTWVQGAGRDNDDIGYTARNHGMRMATGTYLAFLDDDDVYVPEAIDRMRHAIRANENACIDVPVIFRCSFPDLGVVWREPVLRFGNVGTPMLLVPNVPEKLGTWAPYRPGLKQPGGDYAFIAGCVEKMGGPIFREEIVAHVRPREREMTLAIVTPWHNQPDLWPAYREAAYNAAPTELIVVDNASDPPLEFAAIRLEENLGFCGASNIGLRNATTDAVLFLNNDVELREPGWIDAVLDALEPGVLVGPMRYDAHASVDGMPVPYLDGWCLAGMTEDLLELGGFDESLDEPAYFSDNLLCLEARAAGMTLREVEVGLRHIGGASARHVPDATNAATYANRERYQTRARELLVPA